MKKQLLTMAMLALPFLSLAQEQPAERKFDVRIGLGYSTLGTGDMIVKPLEVEANYRLNRYFALGGSVGFGQSNDGVYEMASYMQSNANIFVSPFRNNRMVDFRFGLGMSFATIADAYMLYARYQDNVLVERVYEFSKTSTAGVNITFENSFNLNDRLIFGFKAFTQPYFNGNINTGLMLKAGVRI